MTLIPAQAVDGDRSDPPHHIEKGDGDVLLFLHGVGGGAYSWMPQINSFGMKYKAAAWNMPGYGKSILSGGMTFSGLANSLLALMNEEGWDKVHMIGHSMGGMVAQEFAVDHQDRLHSLTLSATSPAFGKRDGDFQKKFVEARLAPLAEGKNMGDLAAELVQTMMSPEADPNGKQLAFDCMSEVAVETYRAAVECIVSFEQRANLPKITVPTLVLAGELDTNAPAPMMETMASKIPGAQYVCLPALGHLANLEDPQAFDAALSDFIISLSN
ncbi:MAG: alpha/beta hydrolase [Pseudomonadota bacterium]|nr:alpha/beta hydrolase [Pseudomonadota bacterium]